MSPKFVEAVAEWEAAVLLAWFRRGFGFCIKLDEFPTPGEDAFVGPKWSFNPHSSVSPRLLALLELFGSVGSMPPMPV